MTRTVSVVKQRLRAAATERVRGGPRTRRRNVEFAALVAELGGLATEIAASAGWRDVQLVRAVAGLQAAVAADRVDEDQALELALGRRAWYADPSQTWDALLLVARRAKWHDPALSARAAGVLLAVRPKDPGAREISQEALRAVRARTDQSWRTRAAERSATDPVASTLADLAGEDEPREAGWFGVEKALRSGSELIVAAAPELRRSYLGDEAATRAFVPTLRATVARGLADGLPLAGTRPVLDATALQFSSDKDRPELTDIDTVNISGLREYLAGKSVCLIANSADLLELELGAEIDTYDVVIRFNSFAIDPVHTGVKTDLHATIHLHDFNWDVPVDVRVVFGGAPGPWADNVRRHLRPGAQKFLGDDSLRWPRRSLLGPADRERCQVPTSGLNMLLLLDYLDVSTKIDLFGFNFYSGDPYRRDDAMHLPVAQAHSYEVERDWVAERTVSTAPGRISLR